MDSAEIKRTILAESDSTGIRKKLLENREKEGGLNSDDIIEMGNAFEQMVKMKGWFYVEADIVNHSRVLFRPTATEQERITALALAGIMQRVKQTIDAKNAILEKINADRAGKDAETQA
jgi:hypothetical protein